MADISSNKRIAKNTIMLYFRMILLMFVSFYTTRVVLNALGVENFGIYNAVGGIVGFMSFLNGSMSLATNRFLAYAIGKNDNALVNKTFSMSVEIHLIISLIIVILAESVGIWYFYRYLNIPAASYGVAMLIFQLSVVTCFLSINNVPYMGLITAHEDMGAYAYVSIIEAVIKLGIAFLVSGYGGARLSFYAWLMFASSFIIRIIWNSYSRWKYKYIRFKPTWDKGIFNDIFKFIGWQFIGSFSWLLRNQGVNLVLNFFFGPTLNTARTLANQVNGGVTGLVSNFQMAVNPQLTKNFASEKMGEMKILLYRSSKLSFLLLLIIAIPVLTVTEPILKFWLKIIPDYGVIFVRLMIVATLVDALSGTLQHCALATGKIKQYTKVVTTILLSDIVFVYLAYKLGMPPQSMFYVEISLYFTTFIARLFILHKLIDLQVNVFLKRVTLPELLTALCSAILIIPIFKFIDVNTILDIILMLLISFIITLMFSYFIGFNRNERCWIKTLVLSKIHNKHTH